MIHDKRQFGIGALLMAVFLGGLVLIFSPIFGNGRNALDHLDGVFNSVSKASAYYIPASMEKARKLEGTTVSMTIQANGPEETSRIEKLFCAAGATVQVQGTKLAVSGDLGRVLAAALADADAMFRNDESAIAARYGLDGRRALHTWHVALSDATKDLNRQERFRESSAVRDAITKGLEPAYNYYGVAAISMRSMIGVALVALVGYVVYTVWYGYAILFLFEGWGLKLEH